MTNLSKAENDSGDNSKAVTNLSKAENDNGDYRAEAGSGSDIYDDAHHGLLARDLTKEGAKKETRELGRGRGRRRGGGGGQML